MLGLRQVSYKGEDAAMDEQDYLMFSEQFREDEFPISKISDKVFDNYPVMDLNSLLYLPHSELKQLIQRTIHKGLEE